MLHARCRQTIVETIDRVEGSDLLITMSPSKKEKPADSWAKRLKFTENLENSKVKWTLIRPKIFKKSLARPHCEMSFHMTQLFIRHDCFNSYLHRTTRAPSSGCVYCGASGKKMR